MREKFGIKMLFSDLVKSLNKLFLNKLFKNKPVLEEYASTRRERCEFCGVKPVHYKADYKDESYVFCSKDCYTRWQS